MHKFVAHRHNPVPPVINHGGKEEVWVAGMMVFGEGTAFPNHHHNNAAGLPWQEALLYSCS